jgi:transposase-like protein
VEPFATIIGEIPARCVKDKCGAGGRSIVRNGLSGRIESLKNAKRQRYKCKACGFRFSENYNKLHYRLKHKDPSLNSKIFSDFVHGISQRKIARRHQISPSSTRIRLFRLSQRALEFHLQSVSNLSIKEPICVDGLENFAGSQYEPNNINQAIGRDSLFIYDFNFAGLNRKGRTSKWQKLKRDQLDHERGRFDPKAIRISFGQLILRLHGRSQGTPLNILSDEHFQYQRAIQQDLRDLKIRHDRISSKATRNYQNILFAVNHADLLIRNVLAAFKRETISFSKTHGQMCLKYALFMVHKNYMLPQFTKKQVRRIRADSESPAQKLGIAERVLGYCDIFSERSVRERVAHWNEDWKSFWHAEVPERYRRNLAYRKPKVQ